MESTVKPWYINHPEKANVVGDAFSRVSMSNVSHVKEEKMEFARDLHRLVRLGFLLEGCHHPS